MHHVFTLEVDWDGTQLVARTYCGDGWRRMADRVPPKRGRHAEDCGELADLSPFDLGYFLARACRDFTQEWELARQESLNGAALFESLPGERG
jgi:hypothetical protein